MPPKIRADQLIFEQGLAESREQAKRLVMAGKVALLGENGSQTPVPKPGHPYPASAQFTLTGQEQFVSRGAYKLLTALHHFQIDVTGFVCVDVGASTGGFTDCLLQHGASRVYALDVGHAQLHEKLQRDPRVISMEGVNARHATNDTLPEPVDMLVADISFISLTIALPPCLVWLKKNALALTLIKPQFEVGPHQTVKGVVKDEEARQEAIEKVKTSLLLCGLVFQGLVPSAIKGPKGNQEYIAFWKKG